MTFVDGGLLLVGTSFEHTMYMKWLLGLGLLWITNFIIMSIGWIGLLHQGPCRQKGELNVMYVQFFPSEPMWAVQMLGIVHV
jgi:hypothetical protein